MTIEQAAKVLAEHFASVLEYEYYSDPAVALRIAEAMGVATGVSWVTFETPSGKIWVEEERR